MLLSSLFVPAILFLSASARRHHTHHGVGDSGSQQGNQDGSGSTQSSGIMALALSDAPESVGQVCGEGISHTVTGVSLYVDSGVKVTTGKCASNTVARSRIARDSLARRNLTETPLPNGRGAGDECGTPCRTICFDGTGGPDPNDCQVIFENFFSRPDQNFTLGEDGFVLYTFGTCGTNMVNQIAGGPGPTPMSYCYVDWAGAGHFVANHCQGSTGSGGKCVASFGSFMEVPDWYMQVYTATTSNNSTTTTAS